MSKYKSDAERIGNNENYESYQCEEAYGCVDRAIKEAENEYKDTSILLDARRGLAILREKHFGENFL